MNLVPVNRKNPAGMRKEHKRYNFVAGGSAVNVLNLSFNGFSRFVERRVIMMFMKSRNVVDVIGLSILRRRRKRQKLLKNTRTRRPNVTTLACWCV